MLETITAYKTSDGKIHASELEALKHDNKLLYNRIAELNNEICSIGKKKDEALKKLYELQKSDGAKLHGGKLLPAERQAILDAIPEDSGVYMWTNIHDNFKKYVGSAKFLRKRAVLFFNFETSYGGGKELDDARLKYNHPSHWTYTILEFCPINKLEETEDKYITLLDTISNGYNTKRARRTKIHDETGFQGNEDIPASVLNAYNNVINGYALGDKLSSKEKKRKYPLSAFNERLKKLGMMNQPGRSTITLKVKNNACGLNETEPFENLSIIPSELARLINPRGPCFDGDGYPGMIKDLSADGQYMYCFTCSYAMDIEIPLVKAGFKTKKEALKGFLWAKTNISRYMISKNRQYIDDEAYDIFQNMTYSIAERMFLSEENHVFKDGDSEGNEIIPEYIKKEVV